MDPPGSYLCAKSLTPTGAGFLLHIPVAQVAPRRASGRLSEVKGERPAREIGSELDRIISSTYPRALEERGEGGKRFRENRRLCLLFPIDEVMGASSNSAAERSGFHRLSAPGIGQTRMAPIVARLNPSELDSSTQKGRIVTKTPTNAQNVVRCNSIELVSR
jgi:hypothetical protein